MLRTLYKNYISSPDINLFFACFPAFLRYFTFGLTQQHKQQNISTSTRCLPARKFVNFTYVRRGREVRMEGKNVMKCRRIGDADIFLAIALCALYEFNISSLCLCLYFSWFVYKHEEKRSMRKKLQASIL